MCLHISGLACLTCMTGEQYRWSARASLTLAQRSNHRDHCYSPFL